METSIIEEAIAAQNADAKQSVDVKADEGNPPAEAPPVDVAPQAVKTDEPKFDEATYLTEISGGKAKSKEELSDFFNRYTERETELGNIKSSLEKDYIKSSNDFIKKLNDAYEKGIDPEDFIKFSKIELDKITEIDAMKLKLQFEHGYTAEEANELVAHKYKMGEDYDETDRDVKIARMQLKPDGKDAKKFLEQFKSEKLTSPIEKYQQQEQSRIESLMPIADEITGNTNDVKMPVTFKNMDKDETLEIDYQLSPEEKKQVKEGLMFYLNSVKDVTSVNKNEIKEVHKAIVESKVAGKMLNIVANKVAATLNEQWVKKTHNPSAVITGEQKSSHEQKLTAKELAEKQAYEKMMSVL